MRSRRVLDMGDWCRSGDEKEPCEKSTWLLFGTHTFGLAGVELLACVGDHFGEASALGFWIELSD